MRIFLFNYTPFIRTSKFRVRLSVLTFLQLDTQNVLILFLGLNDPLMELLNIDYQTLCFEKLCKTEYLG